MILNTRLNHISKKMLCSEAGHTCKHIKNSIANTGSTTSKFENVCVENPNIFFSEFGRVGYVTKRYKQMTYKTFKSMMVGYAENHTRDM